jgi:hypothetical protein
MLTRIYSGFRGMTFEALSDNLATAKTQRLPVVEPPALPGIKRNGPKTKERGKISQRDIVLLKYPRTIGPARAAKRLLAHFHNS